jgi:hypothetical protein
LPSRKLIIAPQPTPAWPADSPARRRAMIGELGKAATWAEVHPAGRGEARESLPSVHGDDADSPWARQEAGRDGWVRVGGHLARPGDDPLSHPLWGSTLGAARFHGRVRNGVGWGPRAVVTRSGQGSGRPRGAAEIRDQRSDSVRATQARAWGPSARPGPRVGADLEIGLTPPTRPRRRRGRGPGPGSREAWGMGGRGRRSDRMGARPRGRRCS